MTEKLKISAKTGRPYPARMQGDDYPNPERRELWDKLAPSNAKGSDVPAPSDRKMAWLQHHLCDGLIEKPGDWMKLSVDESWWGYALGEMVKAQGNFAELQKRMKALIEAKLKLIDSYESY